MDHHQVQAAAAYKKKDYKVALDLYNKAISRAESAKLLDSRAACKEALGDHDAALKDAKKCIQNYKYDPLGYIRAGLLLKRMNKPNDALQLMAYGLRKVKHAGQSFETLQTMHNRLQLRISPTRCADPLTLFPVELAFEIFGHLSFKALMKLRSVSRGWNQMINSTPEFWKVLDLSQASGRRMVRHAFVERAIKSSRLQIEQAKLNNLLEFDKSLATLIRTCPIESFELGPETPIIGSSTWELLSKAAHLKILHLPGPNYYIIRTDALDGFFSKRCAYLEDLRIRTAPQMLTYDFRRLTTLDVVVTSTTFTFGGRAAEFADRMPMLTTLTVRCEGYSNESSRPFRESLEHFDRLRRLNATYAYQMPDLFSFSDGLSAVTLSSSDDNAAHYLSFWAMLPATLQELTVNASAPIDARHICAARLLGPSNLNSSQPTLRRFSVNTWHGGNVVDALLLTTLLEHPNFAALEHFGLPSSSLVNDRVVEAIVKNMPNITSVDLSGTDINGTAVVLALKAPKLQELDLTNCHRMPLDALRFARSKGVTVHHKQSDASRIPHERSIRI